MSDYQLAPAGTQASRLVTWQGPRPRRHHRRRGRREINGLRNLEVVSNTGSDPNAQQVAARARGRRGRLRAVDSVANSDATAPRSSLSGRRRRHVEVVAGRRARGGGERHGRRHRRERPRGEAPPSGRAPPRDGRGLLLGRPRAAPISLFIEDVGHPAGGAPQRPAAASRGGSFKYCAGRARRRRRRPPRGRRA